MKKITILFFIFFGVLASAETLYVMDNTDAYDKDGKTIIGTIVRGTPGEKIGEANGKIIIKVTGYLKPNDTATLYGTKNLELPFIKLKNIKIDSNTLEVSLPKNELTPNQADAWADAEFLYYDTCSMCHAAHAPKEHNMMEWDGLFTTMRAFAMPTDKDADIIIQYLKAHATDGYATDDE
ncbi:hypothetical protein [Helicobacter cappadocius]|uniref:Molybdopterin-containing oxidoreductase I, DMSO/TMAO/BSO reductase family, monoheme c-type cytochrome n=1 Tax=Helicobacter cappadocius TaxID=3063998 RepID=A0AA90TED9_9HELI|nr:MULTISPECIES: hypothetical protein [unclassified Helicobacter]MDO7252623.1 hypothetical protein [Helicobacter sp. faydin-H75]MDP2538490.1 hypothetical protein [Helicobacter sp. faydin-H76]